jgi:hypothetical protein
MILLIVSHDHCQLLSKENQMTATIDSTVLGLTEVRFLTESSAPLSIEADSRLATLIDGLLANLKPWGVRLDFTVANALTACTQVPDQGGEL